MSIRLTVSTMLPLSFLVAISASCASAKVDPSPPTFAQTAAGAASPPSLPAASTSVLGPPPVRTGVLGSAPLAVGILVFPVALAGSGQRHRTTNHGGETQCDDALTHGQFLSV